MVFFYRFFYYLLIIYSLILFYFTKFEREPLILNGPRVLLYVGNCFLHPILCFLHPIGTLNGLYYPSQQPAAPMSQPTSFSKPPSPPHLPTHLNLHDIKTLYQVVAIVGKRGKALLSKTNF